MSFFTQYRKRISFPPKKWWIFLFVVKCVTSFIPSLLFIYVLRKSLDSRVLCSELCNRWDWTNLSDPASATQLGRETIRVPVFIYREGEKGREFIWRLRSQWCDGKGQFFFFSRSTLFHRKMACNNNPDNQGSQKVNILERSPSITTILIDETYSYLCKSAGFIILIC